MADADLTFALALADLADSLSLPRFRASDLRVETKPDLTPVTDADRGVERADVGGAKRGAGQPGRRRVQPANGIARQRLR